MGKHLDELGSFQDFRAPWETETGDEAEVDKPKLKKLLFNARSAKAAALDERDDAVEKVTTLEADLKTAQAEAANANGEEAQRKIDRLTSQLKEAKDTVAKMEADKELADLRADVLGDLDPKYAKYVKGETREELEKSLEEIKADFNLGDGSEDNDEDNEDEDPPVRNTPRPRLRNVADPQNGKGADTEIDFDKVADGIVGSGNPFA